ncbi:MAG: DUF1566 domain-containing protein [Burkholderiales bacterium]|nr:DUF1566 domain-containing protein [Burkholderiales bacterium]
MSLSASPEAVALGGSTTLSWSSSNATACTASDGWSGARNILGSDVLKSLATTQSYTLSCTGPGGTASRTLTVGVGEPAPSLTLTATPITVIVGQSATLEWAATNVTACTASGSWSGARGLTGSESLGMPTSRGSYHLACSGLGGTARATVVVDVFPAPEPPIYVGAATGDGATTVSWASQAGSFYAGQRVSTNLYVSTKPGIDVRHFTESAPNQVRRGLAEMGPVVFTGFTNGAPLYVVATDVAGGIEGSPSVEITVTPQPPPTLVERLDALNDTGMTACTDLTMATLACPITNLPNQDGDIGRDAAVSKGQVVKTGFGQAGFDFTKLGADGAALAASATDWSCVRDNVTGLTWEVPAATGLTSYENGYTWYQPDPALNGGFAGLPEGAVCSGSDCNTDGFIRALNQAGHCGFKDWRLPTRRELFSLAVFSQPKSIDIQAFPLLPYTGRAYFWSSTVSSGTAGVGIGAWGMLVNEPVLEMFPKGGLRLELLIGYILAVR